MNRFLLVLAAMLSSLSHVAMRDALANDPPCWTEAELRAKAGEEKIKRLRRTQRPASAKHSGHPAISQAATKAEPPIKGVIRRVELPKGKKWIALTLDFCEQAHEAAGYDGAIIDYLREENIEATLFMGGKWMRTHPNRTQQMIADPRFELANHGDIHRDLRRSTPKQIADEINGPNATYQSLLKTLMARRCFTSHDGHTKNHPRTLHYFRFPYGTCNPQVLKQVNAAGLTAIQWDFSSWDSSRTQTAKKIARRMLREVQSGSIILAHANGRGYHTADALKIAVPKLRAKGFRFVTVGKLLAAGTPVVVQRCYNVRPGDTNRFSKRRKTRKPKKQSRDSSWTP